MRIFDRRLFHFSRVSDEESIFKLIFFLGSKFDLSGDDLTSKHFAKIYGILDLNWVWLIKSYFRIDSYLAWIVCTFLLFPSNVNKFTNGKPDPKSVADSC